MIRWIPWALVAVALGLFIATVPSGAVLAVGWLVVILIVRGFALVVASRNARVLIGAVFIGVCFVAAFEGGWYVIPAAVAFLVVDALRPMPAPAPPAGGETRSDTR